MSDLEDHDFDEEPATTVMQDELLAELTARSRGEPDASFADEPTAVATVSPTELFAAAGVGTTDAPSAPATSPGPRRAWRHAVALIAAALVALLAVLASFHRLRR